MLYARGAVVANNINESFEVAQKSILQLSINPKHKK